MTSEEFCNWLAAMKARGFSKQESGVLIGRSPVWVSRAQKDGADQMAALACAAVYIGLQPFTTEAEVSLRPRLKHLARL
jgi:hypothetical protein